MGSWLAGCLLFLAPADLTNAHLAQATKEVAPIVAAARKAEPKDSDTKRALKAAFAKMKPYIPDVRKRYVKRERDTREARAFANQFNELITVGKMHGVVFPENYICWHTAVARKRLVIDLPVSSRWRVKYHSRDQHVGTITQLRPNGKTLRVIKIWRYKWDTIYSGVGGENCKKLAEVIWEQDRDEAKAAGGKASSRIRVKKLNTTFKRAYWYVVETHDEDLQEDLRRREFYVKGRSATMNFEVTDHWTIKPTDDAVTKFQLNGDGPEFMHLLKSLRLNR